MFRSTLMTAFRKLGRDRTYAAMNVTGLTLGIGSALIIFMLIRFEMSFDTFHSKSSRLYKVLTDETHSGKVQERTQGTPGPLAETLATGYESVELTSLLFNGGAGLFTVQQSTSPAKFQEKNGVVFVQPSFFEMFDFQWIEGDPASLNKPDALVLTKSTASRFFGTKPAMGQVVRFENKTNLTVTGIIEDFPKNTDFQFSAVLSTELMRDLTGWVFEWGNLSSNVQTFVLLREGANPADLESIMTGFHEKYRSDSMHRHVYRLEPITEVHFNVDAGNNLERAVSPTTLIALGLIGLFIILTAAINFVNMATAQATNRSREIGVRKVLGAARIQIIAGFIGETFLIVLCSALISLGLVEVAGPAITTALDVRMDMTVWGWEIVGFTSLLVIVVTVLAGIYPALVLSGFRPVLALKGTTSSGGTSLRRGLVVAQFAISQLLIIGTLIVVSQMEFVRNQNEGFDKDGVVIVPIPDNDMSNLENLRTRLESQAGIQSVSFSYSSAISGNRWDAVISYVSNGHEENYVSDLKFGDDRYIETYGMQLLAGRSFMKSDTITEFVVNEAMIRQLGIATPADAIGKMIRLGSRRPYMPIVGVVKDFHTTSMHDAIRPALIAARASGYQEANIRVQGGAVAGTIKSIESEWNRVFPDFVFEYQFLDERVELLYRQELRVSFLFQVFAGMAILIGCIGLLGLVSYMVSRKTKEIGVRKVLGASVVSILGLFSREFVALIGIAFVIAAPVGYTVMTRWLENFAYRIEFGIGVFLVAASISLLIASVTVGYRVFRAATSNPVTALRYE